MSAAVSRRRLGSLLDAKYELVRVLGAGGMGEVYEARHQQLGRRVAIKFLLPEIAARRELLQRFRNEARAAGALHHENISAVYDVGSAPDGAQFMVMEYLEGSDCGRVLERQGPLDIDRACNVVLQVCRGLAAAHAAGILHRDLKPANIFLTQRADGSELAKIIDFGIAKLRRSTEPSVSTGTGETPGTLYYMSPEQLREDAELDQRTDVYALGVVLYELLSGQRPFEADSAYALMFRILSDEPAPLEQLRPSIPAPLCAVVRRAMARDREQRFGTAEALAAALQPYAAGPLVPASRQPLAAALAPTAPARDATPVAGVDARSGFRVARSAPEPRVRRHAPGSPALALLLLAALLAGLAWWRLSERSRADRAEGELPAQPEPASEPGRVPAAPADSARQASGPTTERPDRVRTQPPAALAPAATSGDPDPGAGRARVSPAARHRVQPAELAPARPAPDHDQAAAPSTPGSTPPPAAREVPGRLHFDDRNPYE